MNILFVYFSCMIPTRGGTERAAYTIGKALQARGHNIHFLATSEQESLCLHEIPQEQIFMPSCRTDAEKIEYVRQICVTHSIEYIINEEGDWDDFKIFSRFNFDGVRVISCIHFDVYGRIKFFDEKIKSPNRWKQMVWTFLDGIGISPARIAYRRGKRERFRKMIENSHAVVTPSETIVHQVRRFTGMKKGNVIHMYNPSPFSLKERKLLDVEEKENVILYVGRLSPEKQVHILIDAWAELCLEFPTWKLCIFGDGSLRKKLETQAKELKCERVYFHGNVTDIEKYYQRAKILALTSAHESMGFVVLESLAYYVHPVVFRYASVHEFIKSLQYGTIVKNKTKAGLVRAIRSAIETWNIERQYEADRHLASFDAEIIAASWERFLRSL